MTENTTYSWRYGPLKPDEEPFPAVINQVYLIAWILALGGMSVSVPGVRSASLALFLAFSVVLMIGYRRVIILGPDAITYRTILGSRYRVDYLAIASLHLGTASRVEVTRPIWIPALLVTTKDGKTHKIPFELRDKGAFWEALSRKSGLTPPSASD